jgi:processive 1,2-diacylglycerol beta-glucosyltransferase
MTRPRVHILYQQGPDGQPFSSSYIRLFIPFSQPACRDAFRVSYGADLGSVEADVVVVERWWRSGVSLGDAERLLRQIRDRGMTLVYTLDDNLLDLESSYPHRRFLTEDEERVIQLLIEEADGVVVSTNALRARLAPLNADTFLVHNSIDPRLFGADVPDREASPSGRRVIGYMGTRTHDDDVLLVADALREILERHRDGWELQIVGAIRDHRHMERFKGLPAQLSGPSAKLDYPSFVFWASENMTWDVGIAPLVDNAFTRCKSDMKFLDYGALGIAGVYSDLGPYAETVRHGETGWLAPNSTTAWVEGLERLIADAELRARLAANARRYVYRERTADRSAREWVDALQAILGGASMRSQARVSANASGQSSNRSG